MYRAPDRRVCTGVGGNMFKLAGSVILFGVFSLSSSHLLKRFSFNGEGYKCYKDTERGYLKTNQLLFRQESFGRLKQKEKSPKTSDPHEDLWLGQDSYEKAHKILFEEACSATEKAELRKDDIQFVLAGDLINQITPTSFACRTLGTPYLGLFGACSTSMEGLALGQVS